MAAVIETSLHQAQVEPMTPIDLISCLVSDELTRRSDRLLQRRQKQAQFRDSQKSLENFDFTFNKKMNRSLAFDLATGTFIAKHEDALFLGPPGTGKSHLAQAIGHAAIQQGYRVLYRETHTLLDDLAEARLSLPFLLSKLGDENRSICSAANEPHLQILEQEQRDEAM